MKSIFFRKTMLFSLAVLSLMFSTACEKDKNDDDNKPKVEKMLVGKNWQITAMTVDPPIDWFGTPVRNVYAQLDACSKDDLTIFNANGTVNFDEGPNRCADQPQTRPGLWALSTDQKSISITEDGETTSYVILELSENTLKVEYEEFIEETGITYTFTGTFTKK